MKLFNFVFLLTLIHTVYSTTLLDLSNLANQNAQPQQIAVDTARFTRLLSNHLLFDHFDKAYSQLAKKISYQFRDAIHVKVKKTKSKSSMPKDVMLLPPVDVQILKRQLKGAVGSFIEDKLPAILTNRYNVSTLQNYIDQLLRHHCPQEEHMHQCILVNKELILTQVRHYTTQELQSTLLKVNEFDLPRLFEKTRAQISGILIHFNQHTMDSEHHRLELKIKTVPSNSTLPDTLENRSRDWITSEMMLDFISTINHTDTEEGYTIQNFLDLAM
ncbi:hypothetical protein BD560DRAFT_382834 [Blakeslea trispora]|nr:hypothetical protein BD560DRAFT_382834 [Blakeslea trispora]